MIDECDTGHSPEPHDTLSIPMANKAWVVTGVFLGGQSQENVIGLQVDGFTHDATAHGKDIPELFVPEILIRIALEAGVARLHKANQ